MTLHQYIDQLTNDKNCMVDTRVLQLHDTVFNTYYNKIIYPVYIDADGANYVFMDGETFDDWDDINVVRSWTVSNLVNIAVSTKSIIDMYGESEV